MEDGGTEVDIGVKLCMLTACYFAFSQFFLKLDSRVFIPRTRIFNRAGSMWTKVRVANVQVSHVERISLCDNVVCVLIQGWHG